MISPTTYLNLLLANGVNFISGVPDSLMEPFCTHLTQVLDRRQHVLAVNEGAALALAIGHHIATGGIPLVYLQNSGIGNLVNPLLSLASAEVLSIPAVLLIGWRGEPGIKDEPQHAHQGRITCDILETMDVPTIVLSRNTNDAAAQTKRAIDDARQHNRPVALLIRGKTFSPLPASQRDSEINLTREAAIAAIVGHLEPTAIVVATTGMASRELFEHRTRTGEGHERDFLVVGGMGHASQVALAVALNHPARRIYCLDGDGAMLMHMGALATCGQSGAANFVHFVLNNGAHGSVGGQPTLGLSIQFPDIALACGYAFARRIAAVDDLPAALDAVRQANGPALLEITVDRNHRSDISRPTTTPAQNKAEVRRFLSSQR